MKTLISASALILLLVSDASARSRCQYFSDGREPLCLTTSDTGKDSYTDDRRRAAAEAADRMRKRQQFYQARQQRYLNEGRAHTSDMATGGMRTSSGIVVSPFVPGTAQDRGWQLERQRRGLCGNDQRCLNQR